MNLAVTALAIFFSLATVPSPARAQTPSQTSWQLTPQAASWQPSPQWKHTSTSHVITTKTSNIITTETSGTLTTTRTVTPIITTETSGTLITTRTLTPTAPIPPYVPCPGLYGTPQCCATDLLGLVALDCESPPSVPASPDDFRNICASIGQQARCCLIPLLQQDILCQVPIGVQREDMEE
ncbi:fungal hydrophobin-domain-containing protein [Achaetomium macrosporum]|uniref:Fungal hydrophobin-domain-containing protein n=1 Tax=Achaetomium macrosporum TaxID=79813 RepID=A0AAN7H2T8_9PEZI|nr:fungal hydrophobin-domain-containing protein [Achaetomium macrosporum]